MREGGLLHEDGVRRGTWKGAGSWWAWEPAQGCGPCSLREEEPLKGLAGWHGLHCVSPKDMWKA